MSSEKYNINDLASKLSSKSLLEGILLIDSELEKLERIRKQGNSDSIPDFNKYYWLIKDLLFVLKTGGSVIPGSTGITPMLPFFDVFLRWATLGELPQYCSLIVAIENERSQGKHE